MKLKTFQYKWDISLVDKKFGTITAKTTSHLSVCYKHIRIPQLAKCINFLMMRV